MCGGSFRELLDNCSKSSCAFPIIVRATSVVAKRCYALSSSRRNRAISTCSAVNRPIFSPGLFPASTPASRSFRHFRDLREIDPLLPQIRTALTPGDGRLIRGKMVKLLHRGKSTPRRRTPDRGPGLLLLLMKLSSRTAINDGVDMMGLPDLAVRQTADLLLATGFTRP